MRKNRPLFLTESGALNKGLITNDSPTDIGNAFQAVQNVLITRKGFGPRKGYQLVGTGDNTGTTGINSLFAYKLSNVGTSTINGEVFLRSHTTWLEWFNELGNGGAGLWHTLVAGLTSDKVFGFAPFNTTTLSTAANRLYFGNGVENYTEWNGATTVLNGAVAGGAATINVDSTTLFSASGSLLINGTTVTYSGVTATSFTGCAGTPAADDNDGVAELPDTTTHSGLPKMNYMLTAFSRIWGFGGSGTVHGNRLHYSQAGTTSAAPDPEDFTAAAPLVDPGVRDFPEGGPNINAIVQSEDKIVVLKEDVINTYIFDYTQSTAKFDLVGNYLQGPDVGCGALGAVTQAIQRIYYVSKRGGLKVLDREEGSNLYKPLQLTQRILPTIENFDFSRAKIHYSERDNLILVACASDDDGRDNDTLICYDIQRDAITLFKNISADSFTTYKRESYFGSSITSRVFKLFTGFTDNGSNINASAQTQTYTFGDLGSQKGLDVFYAEGFIKSGRDLNIRFDFDDGTQAYKQITINGNTDNNYIFAVSPNTFGEFEFGEYPFGGDPEEFTGLYIFRVVIKFTPIKAHNVSATFWSSGVGEQWFVKNYGFGPIQGEIDKRIILNI